MAGFSVVFKFPSYLIVYTARQCYNMFVKTIAQFIVTKDGDSYVAEGVDLAIVTQANDLDTLIENIREAVSLHLEGEKITDFDFSQNPSILVNFELPQHA